MRHHIRIRGGVGIKRLLKVVGVSLTSALSGQAQFSINLSSVQSLDGAGYDHGKPINYIYNFTISGNFPGNPDYTLFGIDLSMNGFGDPGAIDGGLGASNVGGWLPSNPPEFANDSVYFGNYYSGGAIQGTISVVSTGSLQDNFSWRIAELGWVYPNYFPTFYTTLNSYSGLAVVPESTNTEFVFGAGVLAIASASSLRWLRTGGR